MLATAAAVADIGVAASNYLASGFGAIDENRKGCLFPNDGLESHLFLHLR